MIGLFKRLARVYEVRGLVLQRKAKVLAVVCLSILIVLPLAGMTAFFVQGKMKPEIHVPTMLGILPVALSLVLLYKGRFQAAGHLVLISVTSIVWTVLLLDPHSGVVRVDTVAYVFPLMIMTPLFVLNSTRVVVGYCGVNVVMFVLFSLFWLPEVLPERYEYFDFLTDTLLAMLFTFVVVYQIFRINKRALEDAERELLERKRAQEMMIQNAKMMSIGGLAAGMAHEINNPLAGMLQSAQLVRRRLGGVKLAKNEEAARQAGISMEGLENYVRIRGIDKMIDGTEAAGIRAARIVETMLSFSRKSSASKTPYDLIVLLDETCRLASSEYNLKKQFDFKTIRIHREYQDGVGSVLCDGNEIQQVFLNLITNAAHSLAEIDDGRTPALTLRVRQEGDQVLVEIEDNGPGLSEDVGERMFEPFFTTKEVGVGTGLGLSISYFIVTEEHGGRIHALSLPPPGGARFTVSLPMI